MPPIERWTLLDALHSQPDCGSQLANQRSQADWLLRFTSSGRLASTPAQIAGKEHRHYPPTSLDLGLGGNAFYSSIAAPRPFLIRGCIQIWYAARCMQIQTQSGGLESSSLAWPIEQIIGLAI